MHPKIYFEGQETVVVKQIITVFSLTLLLSINLKVTHGLNDGELKRVDIENTFVVLLTQYK